MELPVEIAYEYLDLLATAIAADIVPITGENRIMAFHGLKKQMQIQITELKLLQNSVAW